MRTPRDLSGADLVSYLRQLIYAVSRQAGSDMRLTRSASKTRGEQHITIPNYDALRIGPLAAILESVANHQEMTRDHLLQKLLE